MPCCFIGNGADGGIEGGLYREGQNPVDEAGERRMNDRVPGNTAVRYLCGREGMLLKNSINESRKH